MKSPETHTALRFSSYGIVFIVCSTIILILGLYNGNLFLSLAGAAFLIFFVFTIVSTAISFFAWKDIPLHTEWQGPLTFQLAINTPKKIRSGGPKFAMVSYTAEYRIANEIARKFELQVQITNAETTMNIPRPERGFYIAKTHAVVVSDFSGFLTLKKYRILGLRPDPLVVLPEPEKRPFPDLPSGRSGTFQGKSTYRRSEELYEVRPYQPGDDPRKINWKVYAHTGELSIKEGDLLPPPFSEYILILNTMMPVDPDKETCQLFDKLINRIAFFVMELLSRNRIVTIKYMDETDTLRCNVVHPDDINIKDTVLGILSRPQLYKTTSLSPDTSLYMAQQPLLFFTLPLDSVIPDFFPKQNKDLLVFTGPEPPVETREKTRKEHIRDIVFLARQKNHTGNIKKQVAAFEIFYLLLKAEGYHVQKI